MRSYICLVISILLVLVAAIPQQKGKPKGDPRLWMTYKIPLPHPPFAPPDIGPLYLSPDFFKDYPDFSIKQRSRIRQRNLQYHRRHVSSLSIIVALPHCIEIPEIILGIMRTLKAKIFPADNGF